MIQYKRDNTTKNMASFMNMQKSKFILSTVQKLSDKNKFKHKALIRR